MDYEAPSESQPDVRAIALVVAAIAYAVLSLVVLNVIGRRHFFAAVRGLSCFGAAMGMAAILVGLSVDRRHRYRLALVLAGLILCGAAVFAVFFAASVGASA